MPEYDLSAVADARQHAHAVVQAAAGVDLDVLQPRTIAQFVIERREEKALGCRGEEHAGPDVAADRRRRGDRRPPGPER